MSLIFAPQGFEIDQHQSGTASPYALDDAISSSGLAYNLFYGQPITLDPTTGLIAPITLSTQKVYGIFAGIAFVDLVSGVPVERRYYIANTTFTKVLVPYGTGSEVLVRVFIYNTPDTIYRAQFSNDDAGTAASPNPAFTYRPYGGQFNLDVASTTVTQLDGTVFPISGNTTPISLLGNNTSSIAPTNVVAGISYACLNPTQVTTPGQIGQFIVQDTVREARNSWDDPFPYMRVQVNQSVMNAPRTV